MIFAIHGIIQSSQAGGVLSNLKEWAVDNQWVYALGNPTAFTGFSAGDHLRITGGTNWTPGYYAIDNFVSAYDVGDGPHNMIHLTLVPSSVTNVTGGTGYVVLAADMPPSRILAAFDGNSLIAASMPGRAAILRNINQPSAAYRWVSLNFAAGGNTIAQRNAAAPSGLDTFYHPVTCNQLFFSEFINSDYYGNTAAETIADAEEYLTGRKTVGWIITVLEPGPRSDAGTPPTFEANRQTELIWLRDPARIGVHFDRLLPLPSGMGGAGDETGLNYAGDNAHWSALGAQRVAEVAEAVLP